MASAVRIEISISQQTLRLYQNTEQLAVFAVSTARNGAGELSGSGCTPRGRHYIRARIGEGLPAQTVFVGRRPTGEIYTEQLAQAQPQRDWILSRILWLCGLEPGVNRLGQVDSQRRFIYIHGTPDTEPMGVPLSHGCVRMRNDELIWLFDQVKVGAEVIIHE